MNRAEYNARLRAWHPDLNGGDHSHVAEIAAMKAAWQLQNAFCACGCGQKLSATQIKRGGRFYNRQCSARVSNRRVAKLKLPALPKSARAAARWDHRPRFRQPQ